MSLEGLPALLVFGPQSEFPSAKAFQDLRQELTSSPRLSALLKAIDSLPQYWQSLVDFDPNLGRIPGGDYLGQLQQWVRDGGPFPHFESNPPNHYALAVTVLLQICQYSRYLDKLGKDSHRKVLESVKTGGVQGFCVGFLSAVAVATSESEADLGASTAIALRLAVSIGAYVDRDGAYAPVATDYLAVAVRWKEGSAEDKSSIAEIVRSLPQAYISSINDATSVTLTIRADDLDALTEIARQKHLRTKVVSVHGRFHTSGHSHAVDQITKLASLSYGLEFSDEKKLHAPIRNTSDCSIISGGSLTRLALENTLANIADWYGTLKLSVQQLPKSVQTIAYAGFGNSIPASLLRDSSLRISILGNIDEPSHVNGYINGVDGIRGVHKSIEPNDLSRFPSHSIAIVGMAGRFPGADSVDELWDLIMEGKTMVEPAPIETFGLPKLREDTGTKWWGNFLNDREAFDHKFFKKASREALAWDPQQRILLEVVCLISFCRRLRSRPMSIFRDRSSSSPESLAALIY